MTVFQGKVFMGMGFIRWLSDKGCGNVIRSTLNLSNVCSCLLAVGPRIDPLSFQNKNVQLGINVAFMCVLAEGDPPVSFHWKKDGMLVESLERTKVVLPNDFSSSLSISGAQLVHNGNYTCTVTNPVASSFHSALLTVEGNLAIQGLPTRETSMTK